MISFLELNNVFKSVKFIYYTSRHHFTNPSNFQSHKIVARYLPSTTISCSDNFKSINFVFCSFYPASYCTVLITKTRKNHMWCLYNYTVYCSWRFSVNRLNADIFVYKPWRSKCFFCNFKSSLCIVRSWISMLWVYDYYNFFILPVRGSTLEGRIWRL